MRWVSAKIQFRMLIFYSQESTIVLFLLPSLTSAFPLPFPLHSWLWTFVRLGCFISSGMFAHCFVITMVVSFQWDLSELVLLLTDWLIWFIRYHRLRNQSHLPNSTYTSPIKQLRNTPMAARPKTKRKKKVKKRRRKKKARKTRPSGSVASRKPDKPQKPKRRPRRMRPSKNPNRTIWTTSTIFWTSWALMRPLLLLPTRKATMNKKRGRPRTPTTAGKRRKRKREAQRLQQRKPHRPVSRWIWRRCWKPRPQKRNLQRVPLRPLRQQPLPRASLPSPRRKSWARRTKLFCTDDSLWWMPRAHEGRIETK